jgi:hypothetical protein
MSKDNLTDAISHIIAVALIGIRSAFALDDAGILEQAIQHAEDDEDDFNVFLDSYLNDEDKQDDEPADDLWDNPPAASDSWPNVGQVQPKPKVDLWTNPPAKAASWPATTGAVAVAKPVAKPFIPPLASGPKTASTVLQPVVVAQPKVGKPKAASRHNILRETVDRDARRRACCPQALTIAVGMSPLDFVQVAKRAHGTGLVILRKVAKTGHLSTYRVDKDGNIRLSDNLLSKGGLGGHHSIKFRTSNSGDSIIVMGA